MDKRVEYNGLIADNIKRMRIEKGLSQEKLAEKLQGLGIDYTHARISQIELRKRPPTALLLVALKCLYDCEYSEFFSEVEVEYNDILKRD
ncbi:MAG: helix-turn-helix domain-containing protein [Oscillospiraceae bacterium]